jgi:anti-sigma factor (TIGR02949 family)
MTHDHAHHDHPHHESLHDHAHAEADAVDCDAALLRLFDFLDGELDESLEVRLKEHVTRCKPCFERADFERRFLEAVHAARAVECCPKALRERVIGTLRAEGLEA